jgi:hypothetical protein
MSRNFGELVDAAIYKDFEAKASIETEMKSWMNDGYMRMASRDLRCFRKKSTFNVTSASQKYNIISALPGFRLMIEIWTIGGPIDHLLEERVMGTLYYGTDFSEWSPGVPVTSWIEEEQYLYLLLPG